MKQIPNDLRGRPFTHAEARALGVSARMLMGSRFVRIHPRVWRCADHEMTDADHVAAAQLALPDDARLTGITRIQAEGLDVGPRCPVRFVVARDHHIDLDGIFLHRTERMPPTDDSGVTPAAAFIAYCALARVLDAIKVGDWLLHHRRMSVAELRDLALGQQWRDGADEAIWLLEHLDGRSRSLPESEVRSMLVFAGLPAPEVNTNLSVGGGVVVQGDLLYRALRLLVEYEGVHHQEDREQYGTDIDRYADIRRAGLDYVQVTREKARAPKRLVREIHARMVELGYDGPTPEFGDRWASLFGSVAVAVGARHTRFRAS